MNRSQRQRVDQWHCSEKGLTNNIVVNCLLVAWLDGLGGWEPHGTHTQTTLWNGIAHYKGIVFHEQQAVMEWHLAISMSIFFSKHIDWGGRSQIREKRSGGSILKSPSHPISLICRTNPPRTYSIINGRRFYLPLPQPSYLQAASAIVMNKPSFKNSSLLQRQSDKWVKCYWVMRKMHTACHHDKWTKCIVKELTAESLHAGIFMMSQLSVTLDHSAQFQANTPSFEANAAPSSTPC